MAVGMPGDILEVADEYNERGLINGGGPFGKTRMQTPSHRGLTIATPKIRLLNKHLLSGN